MRSSPSSRRATRTPRETVRPRAGQVTRAALPSRTREHASANWTRCQGRAARQSRSPPEPVGGVHETSHGLDISVSLTHADGTRTATEPHAAPPEVCSRPTTGALMPGIRGSAGRGPPAPGRAYSPGRKASSTRRALEILGAPDHMRKSVVSFCLTPRDTCALP
jgi:hypothetical protein